MWYLFYVSLCDYYKLINSVNTSINYNMNITYCNIET